MTWWTRNDDSEPELSDAEDEEDAQTNIHDNYKTNNINRDSILEGKKLISERKIICIFLTFSLLLTSCLY